MKVLCYGVRDVEKPFFTELNKSFGYSVTTTAEYLVDESSAALAKGFDAVILRANCFANKKHLDLFKSFGIQYVLTRTVGVNHMDIDYGKTLGFKMANVPSYSPNAIAELVLTYTMMLVRNVEVMTSSAINKDFRVQSNMFSREIRNMTVGVIGLGKIGFVTAKLFKGLGANVIGYDIFKKDNIDDIVTQVTLDELVAQSDVISLHVPYIKENGRLVTHDFISKMKKDAILINAGRGETVETRAVIDGIKSGHLAGVALDTIENEGELFGKQFDRIDNEDFRELVSLYPKILISPHIGSFTDEAVSNMVETSYDNLKSFIETGDCQHRL